MNSKTYTNDNGITTILEFLYEDPKSGIACFHSKDFEKMEELERERENSRKIELGTKCKKTLELVNDKIEEEWFMIRVMSDTDWSHTPRYNRLSIYRDKLLRKNQQWCK